MLTNKQSPYVWPAGQSIAAPHSSFCGDSKSLSQQAQFHPSDGDVSKTSKPQLPKPPAQYEMSSAEPHSGILRGGSGEGYKNQTNAFCSFARLLEVVKNQSLSNKKSNLYYIRAITLNRVTSGWAHLRSVAPGPHSSENKVELWRAVSNTVSDCTGPGFEPQTCRTYGAVFNHYYRQTFQQKFKEVVQISRYGSHNFSCCIGLWNILHWISKRKKLLWFGNTTYNVSRSTATWKFSHQLQLKCQRVKLL